MIKYKQCGALMLKINDSRCIVANLKIPSISNRSTSYLTFLRETITNSTREEFNKAVDDICKIIKYEK
jgi:hypothetical protein